MTLFRTERNDAGRLTHVYFGKLRIKIAQGGAPRSVGAQAGVNIDGSMMFRGLDLNGNAFGVTTPRHHP